MKTGYTLSPYWQLAYNAHSNTSFSPDKRADDCIISHSGELDGDLLNMPEHEREKYKEGYIKKFTAWLSAKSRCISSMITGPANFPVRRAQKANESEVNRCSEFISWREWQLKKIAKRLSDSEKPPVDPKENAIFKFDAGEVILNYDIDRVQIMHYENPGPAVISIIKAQAFKWSPKNQTWQRQLTDNGKRAACRVTGVDYNLLKII